MVCKNMEKYLNRKKTIKKLAKDLSTLCDIDVLLILYGPDSPKIPETWCSQSDPVTVIDKYYAAKKKIQKKGVKPGPGKNDDNEFLKKLSLEELKDLNGVLAAKIESVNQRINVIKQKQEGNNNNNEGLICNSYETQELMDYGNTTAGYVDYNDGLNVDDLGYFQEINNNRFFGDDVALAEFDFSNNLMDYCEESNEVMVDISDLNDLKFVGDDDDLQLINQLATVQDHVASATEFLCY